jgi:hypothetical protein
VDIHYLVRRHEDESRPTIVFLHGALFASCALFGAIFFKEKSVGKGIDSWVLTLFFVFVVFLNLESKRVFWQLFQL